MAKLSNINNLFSVDSTGAIEFSTQVGTTGYVLESRGAGNAPVWTDRDTGRITGSGTDGQVTYWTSGTNITSNSGFTYNAAGRVTSTESFGVSKDGADTVVDGPFFVLKNAAGTRQYANQLDASNNIDYWYYNGTAWTQTISLLNDGGATFAGNVGIGVTSLQSWARLQVAGTAGAQTGAKQALYVTSPSTTAGEGVGMRMSAASGTHEAVGIIGVVNNASGNAGSMTFHTYNLGADIPERMRIDNNGNVGIAAIPGAVNSIIRVLRIGQRGVFSAYTTSGNVYMSNNVRVIANGNNTAIVEGESAQYRQDGGTHIWYNAASVAAGAVSSLNQRMAISSTGNVGIGVIPSPVVAGNIRLDVGTLGCGITSRQNFETVITANADYGTAVTTGKPATRLYMTNGGEFQFETAPANTAGQPLTFTPRMRIESDGNVFMDSPKGSGENLNLVISDTTTGYAAGTGGSILFQGIFNSNNNLGGAAAIQASKTNSTNGDYSYNLDFYTRKFGSAIEKRMTIDNDGNVGINVSPAGILHAQATSSGNIYSQLLMGYNGASNNFYDGDTQTFRTGIGNITQMTLNSSGDVGIGTTPETAGPTWRTLFIGASATIVSRQAAAGYDSIFANNYYVNSSNQDRVRTTGPSSRMFLDGNNIRFQISPSTGAGGSPTWSEIMRVDDSGNVGIGTTSPDYAKLVVAGKVMLNNASGPNNLAELNIGSTGSVETRAIDIDGSWAQNENKSISFTYSTAATNLVGQINCKHDSPGSRIRWGKLYHSGDSSTYTMELISSSQTTANLTVAGNITAAADVVAYSDERLKSNIKTLDGSKVLKMRGVSFEKDGKKGSGVIAQELEKVAPELVNNDSEYKGVAYGNLVGYLIEAIKDLKAEIEELKSNKCNCNK